MSSGKKKKKKTRKKTETATRRERRSMTRRPFPQWLVITKACKRYLMICILHNLLVKKRVMIFFQCLEDIHFWGLNVFRVGELMKNERVLTCVTYKIFLVSQF